MRFSRILTELHTTNEVPNAFIYEDIVKGAGQDGQRVAANYRVLHAASRVMLKVCCFV